MAQSTDPSGDALAFLQRRVGLFGLVAGGLVLTFLSFRLALDHSAANLVHPSVLTHAGAAICLLGMWVLLRRLSPLLGRSASSRLPGSCSQRRSSWPWAPTCLCEAQPGRILVMALAVVHLARAVYVPSSARRTALLVVVTGVVIVFMTFRANLAVDTRAFGRLSSGGGTRVRSSSRPS